MTIHFLPLTWNSLEVAIAINKNLKAHGFKDKKGKPLDDSMSFGMSDDNRTAFIIYAYKSKSVVRVFVKNEEEEVRFSAGLSPKYATKPQFEKTFNKTELYKASEYLQHLIDNIGITNEETK